MNPTNEEIKRIFGTENPSYDDMNKPFQETLTKVLAELDRQLKSRWVSRGKRGNFLMFKAIIETLAASWDSITYLYNFTDAIGKAVLSIDTALRTPKAKDLDGLKDIAEQKKELDKINEKLKVQMKKEKLAAFQRLDKIRQELLRDDVV